MASNNSNRNRKNIERASQIFYEYGDFIYLIIYTKVQNNEKADDIYQDFFLSLVHRPIPSNIRNIKSFLYRAIINDITDSRRRLERYSTRIQKYSQKSVTTINKTPSENAFKEKEEIIELFELIKELLPGSSSEAITLRFKNDLSVQEVAKQMNVKTASASRYISTGLKKLRQLWSRK